MTFSSSSNCKHQGKLQRLLTEAGDLLGTAGCSVYTVFYIRQDLFFFNLPTTVLSLFGFGLYTLTLHCLVQISDLKSALWGTKPWRLTCKNALCKFRWYFSVVFPSSPANYGLILGLFLTLHLRRPPSMTGAHPAPWTLQREPFLFVLSAA